MRIIELFAGIGACSKALKNIGIDVEIVDAVEIDKYAIKSFNAIHGTNFDVQDMWQTNERFRILQQTLFKIQEIWRPNENKISNGLRIRKLTPRETFRLMAFSDEDFEKAQSVPTSNTQLYKQARKFNCC